MEINRLIKSLEYLRQRLNESGVERTATLYKTMGDDCFYYKKSLDLFERNDYDAIRRLLLEALEEIKLVDGQGSGDKK